MLGGILAFVAVAFTLTIGLLNFLNFTIPALFMLAAMVTWALSSAGNHLFGFGLHWIVAAAIGVLAAVGASLLIERFTYRYMKAKYGDATEHALPLVSSLGFLIVFEHLVITLWGTDPQRFELPFKDTNIRIAGLIISQGHGETVARVPGTNIAVICVRDADDTKAEMLDEGWDAEDFIGEA